MSQRPLEPKQYLSIRYTERLAEASIEPSVGTVGDSYDNAMAETINGLYKTEVIHRRGPWKGLDDVEYATLESVDWFNHRRILEPVGDIAPAEHEANYCRDNSPARKARFKQNPGNTTVVCPGENQSLHQTVMNVGEPFSGI